ncbi:hypothetical protein [Aliivibrio fischeri]|uniref:hypothetical protein n=1 Tax=Aliivibrio fischeri TaxID=668 RepID=UPI00159F0B04|nr:hypothetical protein [Aliivibrio fischeri]
MEIFVYADWSDIEKPLFIGTLRASVIRGKEHFSLGLLQKIQYQLKILSFPI